MSVTSHIVHVLHIGKTGGTAVKHALAPVLSTAVPGLQLHQHQTRLRDIPCGEQVVFFVRDPISRFVSGFHSRQRQGQPRHNFPWSDGERQAFAQFSTPAELGIALSSLDSDRRTAALQAMKNIGHVRSSYWDWFDNEAYFLSRTRDLFFIGFQETLAEDFGRLRCKLHLRDTVRLPDDDVLAHRSPSGLDRELNEAARRNLTQWYARDYRFVELCREIAHELHAAEDGQ
jgi:hypothetical protein